MARLDRVLALGFLAASLSVRDAAAQPASAPLAAGREPPPREVKAVGEMKLHDFAAKWMMQQDDLAETARYAAANRALPRPTRPRVVLMGDSITYHWTADEMPSPAWMEVVNRGVPGQNTSQMLLRFEDDVVAVQPSAVVILGGTNDLRVYEGDPAAARASVLARLERNVTAMADIAEAHRIKVVICAVPPFGADHQRLQRDPATLKAADAWLAAFAASRRYPFADFYKVLADADGDLPPALAADGLHPNTGGHRRMWPQLEGALQQLGLRPAGGS